VWLLVVAATACGGAEGIVMWQAGIPLLSVAAIRNAFPAVNVATVVGVLVGAVILSRHPRHPIGWLFCWGQLGVALGLLCRAVSDGIARGRLAVPVEVGAGADLVANLLGSMFALVLLACLLLLVPDGRLLSRGWLWALLLLLISYVLVVASLLLQFAEQHATSADTVQGPAAVLRIGGEVGIIAGLVVAVVSLLVRLRGSTGETRQQLRWITVAAAFLASAPLLALTMNVAGHPTPVWVLVVLHLGYLGVPLATGLAVLRYRLYEVDRIVGGSVVLAVLVVLAAGVYVLALGLTGALALGEHWTTWSSLVVFVVVALAFQPLREPVRRLADRVVHGRQAMSYEALHTFTHRLARAGSSEPFLEGVAHAAGELVGAQRSRAVLDLEDGTEQSSEWPPAPAPGSVVPTAPGGAAPAWSVPVVHGSQVVGRLELELPDVAVGSGRRRELLAAFADRVAGGFDHARLESALRSRAEQLEAVNRELARSRTRLLAATDLGRRRVAVRIRREVVDRLRTVPASLERVADLAVIDPASALVEVDSSLESVAVAIERLRQITSTVFSRRLTEQGLAGALAAEVWPDVSLRVSGQALRWPAPVESSLYACCVDLIQGLRGPVTVELAGPSTSGTAELSLRCPQMPAAGEWLSSAQERMDILGGEIERHSPEQLVVRLPLWGAEPWPDASPDLPTAPALAVTPETAPQA
jgi:hypothetical protein